MSSDNLINSSRPAPEIGYVELLGLPGSGKTTLRKLMLHQHRKLCSSVARRQRAQMSLEGIKALLLDQAVAGSFVAYPDLFSRVFEALAHVTYEGREREILINYWRSRVSSYWRTTTREMKKPVLVDEGLTQTVFSTLMRISPDMKTEKGQSFAESLVGSLPIDKRVLILIDTPLAIANERQYRNRGAIHRFSNPKGQERINEIYHLAEKSGAIVRRVRGCANLNLMLAQLSETIIEVISSSQPKTEK